MDIQAKDATHDHGSHDHGAAAPEAPAASDVQAFNNQMNGADGADGAAGVSAQSSGGKQGSAGGSMDEGQMKDILSQLINVLQSLLAEMKGGEDPLGGSTAGPGGGVNPVEGSGPGGGAGSSEKIPPPTEHVQELNLGGKKVTVGGDGSASAEEVSKTAASIEHMYENSPTFKDMIDNSSDPSFEVSVGKRGDNTSWGRSDGKVFMNINNIEPGNSDAFQSLLSHEIAHASIDLGHGGEMEHLEDKAASEA